MRLLVLLLVSLAAWAADYRAGTARIDITPRGAIWLAGYPGREHPSTGVAQRLYARAVAIEDGRGGHVVVVAVDLFGITRQLADEVCARAAKAYGLDRAEILLNASHTHNGPVVLPSPVLTRDLPPDEVATLEAYNRQLAEWLVTAIGAALGDLRPARLGYGQGETDFAVNVRPEGPVDHRVPVIRLTGEDGAAMAVIFGYACDNATFGEGDYEISGDYAGDAAARLEEEALGSVAVFVALCGADQVPEPRGGDGDVARHGEALAMEVRRVMDAGMKPVRGPLRTAFQLAELRLVYRTREEYEEEIEHGSPAAARRARLVLDAYGERRPMRGVAYPVQAVRFGNGPVLLALGGEVVVEYSLRVRREFPGVPLIVTGYSNDVMGYVASGSEDDEEAGRKAIEYGLPGPFAGDTEEAIWATARRVLGRVGVRAGGR